MQRACRLFNIQGAPVAGADPSYIASNAGPSLPDITGGRKGREYRTRLDEWAVSSGNTSLTTWQSLLKTIINVKKMEEIHMARIAGVDLPRDKRVEIGLTYIYGIGRASSNRILAEAGVNPDIRCRDLTDEDVKKISAVIDETQMVEGDLRREIALNIKRLQEIGCYRGIRHRKGLPVRGQKTKTNARTRKGPKRTVANKKK